MLMVIIIYFLGGSKILENVKQLLLDSGMTAADVTWFHENKIEANPKKFQSMFCTKQDKIT